MSPVGRVSPSAPVWGPPHGALGETRPATLCRAPFAPKLRPDQSADMKWLMAIAIFFMSLRPIFAMDEAAGRAEIGGAERPPDNLTNHLGSWIWADKTFERQECHLWKSFKIPATATVKKAR